MKIIVAKRIGREDIAYINASRISSFIADNYDDKAITKIYFSDSKCEIEGDYTKQILEFMLSDEGSGLLDLTKAANEKSYWTRRGNK